MSKGVEIVVIMELRMEPVTLFLRFLTLPRRRRSGSRLCFPFSGGCWNRVFHPFPPRRAGFRVGVVITRSVVRGVGFTS